MPAISMKLLRPFRSPALPVFLLSLFAALMVLALPGKAFAHAMLQTSSPAANATVRPGIVPIVLTYNSRVDAEHSSLSLMRGADAKPVVLAIDTKAAANVLRSQSSLEAGHYVLHWQAVASDGHISRGQVAFDVK